MDTLGRRRAGWLWEISLARPEDARRRCSICILSMLGRETRSGLLSTRRKVVGNGGLDLPSSEGESSQSSSSSSKTESSSSSLSEAMAPSSASASESSRRCSTISRNEVVFFCIPFVICFRLTLCDRELRTGGGLSAEGRASIELSSSSDDAPSWNIFDFFAGDMARLLDGTGRPVNDLCLNEVDTGEKPCTTEPLRMRPSDDTEVSELRWSLFLVAFVLDVVIVVPEMHDSVEFCNCLSSGCSSSTMGVIFSGSTGNAGIDASIDGDRGPTSDTSCIWTMIFSKTVGVKCGSLPRDFDRALSSSSLEGRLLLLGTCCCGVASSSSLELLSDPYEFDNDGTSLCWPHGMSIAGIIVFSGCGGQHNVSLAHILQLMFSYLLPPLMFCEHLLNTVHMPNSDSTFRGSTEFILAASSVRTGAFKREGIATEPQYGLESS